MKRYLLGVLAALTAVVVVLAPSTAWGADEEEPSIAHVQATEDGLRVLVSLPPGTDVELHRCHRQPGR